MGPAPAAVAEAWQRAAAAVDVRGPLGRARRRSRVTARGDPAATRRRSSTTSSRRRSCSVGAQPVADGVPRVAIVGTRRCTRYGFDLARELGADLAACGVQVVSGLALGIDGAAHRGALDAAGGAPPVAVVASGLDVVYPRRHRALWEEVRHARVAAVGVPARHRARGVALPGPQPHHRRAGRRGGGRRVGRLRRLDVHRRGGAGPRPAGAGRARARCARRRRPAPTGCWPRAPGWSATPTTCSPPSASPQRGPPRRRQRRRPSPTGRPARCCGRSGTGPARSSRWPPATGLALGPLSVAVASLEAERPRHPPRPLARALGARSDERRRPVHAAESVDRRDMPGRASVRWIRGLVRRGLLRRRSPPPRRRRWPPTGPTSRASSPGPSGSASTAPPASSGSRCGAGSPRSPPGATPGAASPARPPRCGATSAGSPAPAGSRSTRRSG